MQLQPVRSYKLRGAFNKISTLDDASRSRGVVCASAGNHAQGFAYSCQKLGIKGVVYMPKITPKQKVAATRRWGGDAINIVLTGDTFDDAAAAAREYQSTSGAVFVHPFDDAGIIEGQGTVGLEILQDCPTGPDYVFLPVGGGGLAAGVSTVLRAARGNSVQIIGVEPEGAPSMLLALRAGAPVRVDKIDPFVDGAAVKRVGDLTYAYCSKNLDKMHLVPEGAVCTTTLRLYQEEAIVAEPAGCLSIAALEDFAQEIKGKTVVAVVSGGNSDIERIQEIKDRSLQHEGLLHYFLIRFAQRPGSLREFVSSVLGPEDDIVRFEYLKKTAREQGPALVGIEVHARKDYEVLLRNMRRYGVDYTEVNKDDKLWGFLV